jgi:hypothetical protein
MIFVLRATVRVDQSVIAAGKTVNTVALCRTLSHLRPGAVVQDALRKLPVKITFGYLFHICSVHLDITKSFIYPTECTIKLL